MMNLSETLVIKSKYHVFQSVAKGWTAACTEMCMHRASTGLRFSWQSPGCPVNKGKAASRSSELKASLLASSSRIEKCFWSILLSSYVLSKERKHLGMFKCSYVVLQKEKKHKECKKDRGAQVRKVDLSSLSSVILDFTLELDCVLLFTYFLLFKRITIS